MIMKLCVIIKYIISYINNNCIQIMDFFLNTCRYNSASICFMHCFYTLFKINNFNVPQNNYHFYLYKHVFVWYFFRHNVII